MMPPKKRLRVVALSGKMRSGKTFVANHLVNKHGFQVMRFAGPLKDDIRAMGFPEAAIEAKPAWMRLLMQAYGQAWRAVNPDHWVEQLMIELNQIRSFDLACYPVERAARPVVLDDMRFENEARALRALNPDEFDVKLIRLFRVGEPGDVAHTQDQSECDLDHYEDWDAILQARAGDPYTLTFGVNEILKLDHSV